MAELSSFNRQPTKSRIFSIWPFLEKFCCINKHHGLLLHDKNSQNGEEMNHIINIKISSSNVISVLQKAMKNKQNNRNMHVDVFYRCIEVWKDIPLLDNNVTSGTWEVIYFTGHELGPEHYGQGTDYIT